MAEPLPLGPLAPTNRWASDGLPRGLAFAAAAAVLAAAIWYLVVVITEYELGIVAALVGWVVGTAAVIGSGRRGSLWLVAGSVLLTLTALFIAEYLILYHFATQFFGAFPLIQPPWVVIQIVIEYLASEPISLLFWGFALFSAASVPFKTIGDAPEPAGQPLPAAPDGHVGT